MKKGLLLIWVIVSVLVIGCGGAREKAATAAMDQGDAGSEEVESGTPVHADVVAIVLSRCQYAAEAIQSLVALKREMGPALGLSLGFMGVLDEHGKPDPKMGEAEIMSSMVQICVGMKAKDEPWLDFLECVYEKDRWRSMPASWKECAKEADVDVKTIEECLSSGEGEATLSRSYGASMASDITASPTMIIGDRLYVGDRSVEALRVHLCHMVGNPETAPAACKGVDPPRAIAATFLYDSRCKNPAMCNVDREIALLEQIIPGLKLTELDFTTDKGRHLFELVRKTGANVRELPVVILEEGAAGGNGTLAQMSDYLIPFGKGFLLNMGNGWNPLAEICDNGTDDTGNGKTDCDDPECSKRTACREEQKARLDLFMMSGCPFSAELLPSIDHFLEHFGKDSKTVSLRLQFIGDVKDGKLTSMHGEDEVAEDLRMICAQDLYGKNYRFIEYVKCRAKTYDSPAWEPCVPEWMNKKKLRRCAEGKRGTKLLEESYMLAEELGITGSPSWLLNNRLPMTARDTNTIIRKFCAQNELPACDKEMAKEPEVQSGKSGATCR